MKKTNNIKIAVDWDGTLARTMDFVCELINFKTGENFKYKDIKSWTHWEDIGLGKEFWAAYDFMDRNGRDLIRPYDDEMCYALEKISKLNNKFDIVTANNEIAGGQIAEWLYERLDGGIYFNVNCIGRKTAADKLALDYSIYIDDNPNLADEAKNHPSKYILLANAPWNKHIKNSFNVKRFESWKEVPELIKNTIK